MVAEKIMQPIHSLERYKPPILFYAPCLDNLLLLGNIQPSFFIGINLNKNRAGFGNWSFKEDEFLKWC